MKFYFYNLLSSFLVELFMLARLKSSDLRLHLWSSAIYEQSMLPLQGLFYSPKHWPCLDNLVTVLFAIGDYAGLLDIPFWLLATDSDPFVWKSISPCTWIYTMKTTFILQQWALYASRAFTVRKSGSIVLWVLMKIDFSIFLFFPVLPYLCLLQRTL